MSSYSENMEFEAEVRRVAEAVWGLKPGDCKPKHYEDAVVKELDGIARLRDVTHLLMVTVSTKLQKAKEDIAKLNAAERVQKKQDASRATSKWFITRSELDARHHDEAKKNGVIALTLEQFRRRYFDSYEYIAKRRNAPFGSARNPRDNTINIPDNLYVPTPINIERKTEVRTKRDTKIERKYVETDLRRIAERIANGDIFVLLGPFGSGKSLTTREIFGLLASMSKGSGQAPLTINLREHWGQDYFDEILERHARSIGFTPKENLVAAWRGGMASLLIDGFDEAGSQALIQKNDVNFMRTARHRALQGVRDFLTKLPAKAGAWICGRDHYFDSESEMVSALGLSGKSYEILRLEEFTEKGAAQFLLANGFDFVLPDWLPRKPLLLSYLIQNELINEVLAIDGGLGFGHVWDEFLTKICERESLLERSVMNPHTVRSVMERLAHWVRRTAQGTGPIAGPDLARVYEDETSQVADEAAMAQLQRLPGLTQRDNDPGMRSFVDEDMLSALQGSAFAASISRGGIFPAGASLHKLSSRSISIAIHMLRLNGYTVETLVAVARRLQGQHEGRSKQEVDQAVGDCVMLAMEMAIEDDRQAIDFQGILVEEADIGNFSLDQIRVGGLHVKRCTVSSIAVGPDGMDSQVDFSECIVSRVMGVASDDHLPKGVRLINCEVAEYEHYATTSAIMKAGYPPSVKAAVSILRKLYKQAGSGRKYAALKRGITDKDAEARVDAVIEIMEREGLLRKFNAIVHPVRKESSRVDAILAAPLLSDDAALVQIRDV